MPQTPSVFHAGELAVQAQAKTPAAWQRQASRFIRPTMPEQHRTFFEGLPLVFLGFTDGVGRVWATTAYGKPGFMRTPTDTRLDIAAAPVMAQALGLETGAGSKVGLLGLDLSNRRRNRLNGTVIDGQGDALSITVDQSYGNCPQYIQVRDFDWQASAQQPQATAAKLSDSAVRALLAQADTFFIASRAKTFSDAPEDGIDVSHRGGRPGFLHANEDGTLSFPDFAGNRMYNTLGNIAADGRIGLWVPDFATGQALYITGRASIDWSSPRIAAYDRAQRMVDVTPEEMWLVEGAIPAKSDLAESWPMLAKTGSWEDVQS